MTVIRLDFKSTILNRLQEAVCIEEESRDR